MNNRIQGGETIPAPVISSKVYIPPAVGAQTSTHRFGKGAPEKIRDYLREDPFDNDDDSEEEDDDDHNDTSEIQESSFAEDDEVIIPEPGQSAEPAGSIPNFARLRINCTALSQRFNLYFVAYQDKIYVYLPQQAPDILPHPVIILKPGRTHFARQESGSKRTIPGRYGGYMRSLDRHFPHQVNHVTVGDLGREEILVLAYDDGDVVAYYTAQIVKFIQSQQAKARGDPLGKGKQPLVARWNLRPFFHDTVGITAWGVAIHQQSRLIAVSSNYHEVHVFAFALKSTLDSLLTKPSVVPENDKFPRVSADMGAVELEHELRKRDREWRIILPVGTAGNNIPTVSFWNDERGNAEMVAAADVNGHLFLLDIWKVGFQPIRLKALSRQPLGLNNTQHPVEREGGWGVLVLPIANFLRTESVIDTVGTTKRGCQLRPQHVGSHLIGSSNPNMDPYYHEITESLLNVEDNDGRRRLVPLFNRAAHTVGEESPDSSKHRQPEQDIDSSESDDDCDMSEAVDEWDTYVENPVEHNRLWSHLDEHWAKQHFSCHHIHLEDEAKTGNRFSMIIEPFKGRTYRAHTPSALAAILKDADRRKGQTIALDLKDACKMAHFESNGQQAILRTFATDIELLMPSVNPTPVVCRRVLEQYNHFGLRNAPWDLSMADRACFIQQIPELSIVVVGSMNGRVAILRTTRASEKVRVRTALSADVTPVNNVPTSHERDFQEAFRVEWILPRTSDEKRRLRPYCCLLGVAVSPMPVENPVFDDDTAPRGRSRRLTDGIGKPSASAQRWRIILHYMNHTILMYTLSREKPDGTDLQLTLE